MPPPHPQARRGPFARQPSDRAIRPALGTLALLIGVLLAPVALAVLDAGWSALASLAGARNEQAGPEVPDLAWLSFGPTLQGFLIAGVIASAATLLSIAPALLLGRGGRASAKGMRGFRPTGSAWLPVVCVPLFMPPYLAYSGWGVLRDPTWATGRWIVESGFAGTAPRALAVLGLSLWSWPIAAAIVAASVRARDRGVTDSLRLEPLSWHHAARFWARTHRPALLTAWCAIAAIMLGSAVPLHLSQFKTLAIRVWIMLDQTPDDLRWRVWTNAWPLLAAAAVAAWLIASRLVDDPDRGRQDAAQPADQKGPDGRAARRPWIASLSIMLLTASIGVPIALFGLTLARASALSVFIERAGSAMATSASLAASLGAGAILLCVVSSITASAQGTLPRFASRWSIRLTLLTALIPGVLVGDAWLRALNWPALAELGPLGDLRDHPAAVALAQGTRLAFIPVITGWWIARREPTADRWARRLETGDSPRSWWGAIGSGRVALILACGLAVATLSIHEIEAAIMVQPPGVELLARHVLDDLHFERPDQRSAAGLLTMGAALLTAVPLAFLLGLRSRQDRGSPGGKTT